MTQKDEKCLCVWPIKWQCCLHTETTQLICYANQLTGFYMSATLALMGQTQVQEKVLGLLPEKNTTYASATQKLLPHKKWSFPLRIYSVNVTKSAGDCGFGHIYSIKP